MMHDRQGTPNYPLHPAQIRSALGISVERMARLMDVRTKTIERWEQDDVLHISARLRSQLAHIQGLIVLGVSIYTPDGFRQFLDTPLPELNGQTALQMLENDHLERVQAALAADYEGLGF